MKNSGWFLSGCFLALAAGAAFFLTGFWQPGRLELAESGGPGGSPLLNRSKKTAETQRQGRADLAALRAEGKDLAGTEGEHRVFVSTQLVYLPQSPEPVQSLDRKMKTEDGLEVGWKIKHGFDPADPEVAERDPDGDGFTNREEFLAQTDPTNRENSPAKESKLKSRSDEPVPMAVSFQEKSGDLVTVQFSLKTRSLQGSPPGRAGADGATAQYRGRPGNSFWLMAGPDLVEVFTEAGPMEAARQKAKQEARNTHVIPLRLLSFEEKLEQVSKAAVGGVQIFEDNSTLKLERQDAVRDVQALVFSSPSRPRSVVWDVGNIRFFAPVSGGIALGPFRVGETFRYEGKDFSIVGREGKKIQLRNLGEAGQPTFWVPPESPPVAPAGRP